MRGLRFWGRLGIRAEVRRVHRIHGLLRPGLSPNPLPEGEGFHLPLPPGEGLPPHPRLRLEPIRAVAAQRGIQRQTVLEWRESAAAAALAVATAARPPHAARR